jgi:hypothetical protein
MITPDVKTYIAKFEIVGVPLSDIESIMTNMFGFMVDDRCEPIHPGNMGLVFEGVKEVTNAQLVQEIHHKVSTKIKKFHFGAKVKSKWTLIASTRPTFSDIKPVECGDKF